MRLILRNLGRIEACYDSKFLMTSCDTTARNNFIFDLCCEYCRSHLQEEERPEHESLRGFRSNVSDIRLVTFPNCTLCPSSQVFLQPQKYSTVQHILRTRKLHSENWWSSLWCSWLKSSNTQLTSSPNSTSGIGHRKTEEMEKRNKSSGQEPRCTPPLILGAFVYAALLWCFPASFGEDGRRTSEEMVNTRH